MSFLDRLKDSLSVNLPKEWQILSSVDQFPMIRELSKEQPVAIFKHSTSCGVSAMAKYQLEEGWDISQEELSLFYLDLWKYRPVSNAVAESFGVVHQSPQLIIIKDGEVVDLAAGVDQTAAFGLAVI